MELYNFFTETVTKPEDVEHLKSTIIELKRICHFVKLVEFNHPSGAKKYSIIGQIYGDDSVVGDLDLIEIFGLIKFTWIDAENPELFDVELNVID